MTNVSIIFGKNIKRLRKQRHLTQEEFAELVKMEWKSITNFERGRNVPNTKNLQKICDNLNITPCELFLNDPDLSTSGGKIEAIKQILTYMSDYDLDAAYRIIQALNEKPFFKQHKIG